MSKYPYSAAEVAQEDRDATAGFGFSHTMIRIKDPKISLDFYTRILGMTLVHTMNMEQFKFTNYFLCFPQSAVPENLEEKKKWLWNQQAVLELCHNWGTEEEKDFKYHHGNVEPRGFGHLAVIVPDMDAACARFEKLGVVFTKKPNEGSMKGIAFICDPDEYRIELVTRGMTSL